MFLLFAVAFKCMHVREIEWEEGGAGLINVIMFSFLVGGSFYSVKHFVWQCPMKCAL